MEEREREQKNGNEKMCKNCEEGKTKSLRTARRLHVERVNGFNAFKYLTKHVKSKKVNKEFCGLRNLFKNSNTN